MAIIARNFHQREILEVLTNLQSEYTLSRDRLRIEVSSFLISIFSNFLQRGFYSVIIIPLENILYTDGTSMEDID